MPNFHYSDNDHLHELYGIHQRNLDLLNGQIARSMGNPRPEIVGQANDERTTMQAIIHELQQRGAPLPATVPPQEIPIPSLDPPSTPLSPAQPARRGSPFMPGKPLNANDPIFGREATIQWVCDQVAGCKPVNLVAERRMGKSSLLNHIEVRLQQELSHACNGAHFLWLRCDLQGTVQNQDDFYGLITAQVLAHVQPLPQAWQTLAQQLQQIPQATFAQCDAVLRQFKSKVHPVMLIDEFEQWLEPTAITAFPYPDFFNHVRSLIGDTLLTMVVASRAPLAELVAQHPTRLTSTFHSYFNLYELQGLDDVAADALLLQDSDHPLQAFHVSEAKRWAQGHPCLLQLAGQSYYEMSAYQHSQQQMLALREQRKQQLCTAPKTVQPKQRNWFIRMLAFVIWEIPKRIGRVAQVLGAKIDEMAAWLIGMALLILLGLLIANFVTGNQVWEFLRSAFGLQ